MATIEVYVNPTSTAGPKLWAYVIQGNKDDITWGSVLSGGHQKQKGKPFGYGRKKEAEKIREGYDTCGGFAIPANTSFDAVADAIFSDVRSAAAGMKVITDSGRAHVLREILRISGRASHRSNVRDAATATPTPAAPPATPKPKPKATKAISAVVTKGAEPSKFDDW